MVLNDGNIVKRTSQYTDNLSFDEQTRLNMVELAGTDGSAVYRVQVGSDGSLTLSKAALAQRIQTSGTDTYIAHAIPGTASSAAAWRAKKIDSTGNVTWADGNANFDNIATSLSGLSYS